MSALILIITGLFVGLISTFFGVGGGIIALPLLYHLFPELPPQSIIGASLGMVLLNSLLNTFHFIRDGRKPLLKLALPIALSMIIGAITGSRTGDGLSPEKIKFILGLILVAVTLKTVFSKTPDKSNDDQNWLPDLSALSLFKTILVTFTGGFLLGLIGIGGGVVMIPYFLIVMKMPFKWIPVYSNIGMGAGSLATIIRLMNGPNVENVPQIISAFQVGFINWAIVALLVSGVLLSSPFGVKLSGKADPVLSKRLFAMLLSIMAIKIFYSLR